MAVGVGATVSGHDSTAVGDRAQTHQNLDNVTVVGSAAESSSGRSVAIGSYARVGTDAYGATAVGMDSRALYSESVALGHLATTTRRYCVSIGDQTNTRVIERVSEPSENTDAATKHYVDSQLAATGVSIYVGSTEPTNWSVGDYWIRTDSNKNALDLNVRTS